MKLFLKDSKWACKVWFDEVHPWSKSSVYRRIPLWIVLEEVPLHLWDCKFFKALGDLWGIFLEVDPATASRSRFDVAKILVIVDSRFKIPLVVSVKNGDCVFKIKVSLEEDLKLNGKPIENCMLDCSGYPATGIEVEFGEGEKASMHAEDDSIILISDLIPRNWVAVDFESGAFSLHLSVEELIGGKSKPLSDTILPIQADTNEFELGRNGNHEDQVDRMGEWDLSNIEGLKKRLDVSGPCVCGGKPHLAIVPWVGSDSIGPNSNIIELVGQSSTIGFCFNNSAWIMDGKMTKKRRRKYRKMKRGINVMVYGANANTSEISDSSISDEEITNRNRLILKEAEINTEVGSALGFDFMRSQVQMVKVYESMGGNDSILSEVVVSEGNSGGLISCWRDQFFVVESKYCSQRSILLIGRIKQFDFRCGFGNIYAPNDDRDMHALWEELQSFIENLGVPWCLAGDFNIVRSNEEKIGLPVSQQAMDSFSGFIDSLGFIDLPLEGGRFTWCSNREIPTFCRLDRFLIASEFLGVFPDLVQKVWPHSLSDHNPISLEIAKKDWGPTPFKFYNHWFEMNGFQKFLKEKWASIRNDFANQNNLWGKFKFVKYEIKEWVKQNGGSNFQKITKLEEDIHALEVSAVNGGNWESVRTELGGLGIVDLNLKNHALLSKWIWRFADEKDALWRKLIIQKYGGDSDSLIPDVRYFRRFSPVWRNITKPLYLVDELSVSLANGMGFALGNGASILFWSRDWIPGTILKLVFPRIFVLANLKEGKVGDYGSFVDGCWVWNVVLRRNVFDWEKNQWEAFLRLLEEYQNFCSGDWSKVFNGLLPPKVELFCWQLLHGKVAVRANLASRNVMQIASTDCPLCGAEIESVCHLFFSCMVVWKIWSQWCVSWNLQWAFHPDPWSFFQQWIGLLPTNYCDKIWVMSFGVIVWSIWLVRNDVVFNNKPGHAGIGGTLRNHLGLELCNFSKYVGVHDSNVAKLLAIKEALEVFTASSWCSNKKLIIESDSKIVVGWVNKPNTAPWRIQIQASQQRSARLLPPPSVDADAEMVTYLLKSALMLKKIVIDIGYSHRGERMSKATEKKKAKNLARQLVENIGLKLS
ncbi:hypothetical protein PTKIN_Ptkin01aG0317600 [Pterospermum kingtungense]